MSDACQPVQEPRNYCNNLKDDGPTCGDYVEQLTFLLSLKAANPQDWPPFNNGPACGAGFLIAAHDYTANYHSLNPLQEKRLATIADYLRP